MDSAKHLHRVKLQKECRGHHRIIYVIAVQSIYLRIMYIIYNNHVSWKVKDAIMADDEMRYRQETFTIRGIYCLDNAIKRRKCRFTIT
jgi:hypothetical protein